MFAVPILDHGAEQVAGINNFQKCRSSVDVDVYVSVSVCVYQAVSENTRRHRCICIYIYIFMHMSAFGLEPGRVKLQAGPAGAPCPALVTLSGRAAGEV